MSGQSAYLSLSEARAMQNKIQVANTQGKGCGGSNNEAKKKPKN